MVPSRWLAGSPCWRPSPGLTFASPLGGAQQGSPAARVRCTAQMRVALEWQCVGGLGLLQSHAVPTCAHALLEGPNPEGRSVSGRKGQHGGSCSVFFFGRGWGRKGSTRQSLPLDSLVWPAVSLAESPTHGSKLGMQIVQAGKAPPGGISASPESKQLKEERQCPHPSLASWNVTVCPKLLWRSAAGMGLESRVS